MRGVRVKKRAALAAASAAISVALLAGSASAHNQGDAVTISMSGATFMRAFTTSAGFTLLTPDTSITLNSGPGGTPVTYSAASGFSTSVQLAARNFLGTIDPNPTAGAPPVTNANYYGIRLEWHEQGSIEGVLELINDQIGPVASVGTSNRNATSGNPTWVNGNGFGVNGANVVPPPPASQTVVMNGFQLSTSTYNTYTNYNTSGQNLQGGQNRVQWGISDVPSKQGFSRDGQAAWNRRPNTAGYGLGNQALPLAAGANLQGLGVSNVRQRMNDGSVANMSTDKIDPETGLNYTAGPWNDAGVENLRDVAVSVGGLSYVANPGTGLERINRSDGVWLHTTGRLANGADFNVVTRDVYSGTANTAANNLGLDISWSTGENDDNNGNAADGGTARSRIGPEMRFSKKTSGGQQVRPTVQNSRMAFGHLSSADAVPQAKQSSSRPIRGLDFRDDWDDLANGSNNALAPELRNNQAFPDPITGTDASLDIYNGFTRLTARSLVEGSYEARAPLTYVFVREPNAVQYTQDVIKGDNIGNDVRDVRDNIMNAVANFPPTSIANPADALLQTGFLLPQFVKYLETFDGLNTDFANPNYNASLSNAFLGSTYVNAFNTSDPASVTTGASSTYGNSNIGTGNATPLGGAIPITDKNWLFGDFDQRAASAGVSGKGVRDMSDLSIAQQAQAALAASALGTNWNVNAGSNATDVAGLPAAMNGTFTKGDLIVLGDFDSDGDFDGQDLYRMARGTSLADSAGSTILTGVFADSVRRGVLRKNAALDLMQSTATAAQKAEASADGGLEFVKQDVNRDGKTDLSDAFTVDKFIGRDYRNLDDQLAATITVGTAVKPISLVDVELNDTGNVTQADLDLINTPRLTLAGNESWSGATLKTGTGHINIARPAGVVTVAPGATLQIQAGQLTAGGAVDPFTDSSTGSHLGIVNNAVLNIAAGGKHVGAIGGTGRTNVAAGATLTVSGLQSHGAGAALVVSGRANLNTNAGAPATSAAAASANLALSISGTSSKVVLGADQDLKSLTISITDAGLQSLDLNSPEGAGEAHSLRIYAADLDAAKISLYDALKNTATTAEDGIYDSGLVNHPGSSVGLGKKTDAHGEQYILITPTRTGDLNLDGQVTIADFIDLASNFNGAGTWQEGDLNRDGQVTIADFIDLASNFNSSYSGHSWAMEPQEKAMLSQFASSLGIAVPEPSAVITVLAIALAATRRQRRR